MPYQFGKRSLDNLKTCHADLQAVLKLALSRSKVDFGISEGHRSIERQKLLFDQGKSKIDGIVKKGKHNYSPSLAADIFIYHPDLELRRKLVYDTESLSYVAGLIDSCAEELFEKGEISHKIRWGANWDSDGVIALDQAFDDYPHFELIKS
jgi:peptidoglycan L-alanyl-D-glutamate endopeptidase CwlK